jgi:hypothetical protein
LFLITCLGSGEEIAFGKGFVICGTLAWLVSPALTMVVYANDRAHNTFCDDLMALLGDVAKFTLYFTRILSELGQIHYMKSW